MASDLHRTATTAYLCCVPTLEEFAGAGRVGLAAANIQSFYVFARKIVRFKFLYLFIIFKKTNEKL